MMFIITLFYLSLFLIIGMIGIKLVSLRNLKLSLIEGAERELYEKFCLKVTNMRKVLHKRYYGPFRTFAHALFFYVAHQVLHAGLIVGNKVRTRHSKWYNMVKGRGVIKQKGSVSFFLQNVTDYKKSISVK